MAFDWTGIDMETAGEFRFVTWLPGLTNDFINATYDIRLSHLYADNTRARVYLCNSSTAAGCTQKFLVAPSAWSGTSITTEGVNIPSGYNWVYVVNAAGEVNSSGYEFTITGCD
jgi:hypothetical protein